MAKDTYYFSHDYNARTDAKIKKLLMTFKAEGYGVFWMIVEDLYNNANALQTDYDSIAFDLRVDKSMVESIINDFDLFVIKDGFFGSKSIESRLDEREEKSSKARKSAFARWNKDANALPSQSDSNAIKERKEKERKEKERKEAEDLQIVEIDYLQIAEIFNEICNRLPKVNKISKARENLIKARIKEYDLETIGKVFNKVAESDFLNGKNNNGWTATFDWIFNTANFLKILEDNYINKIGNNEKELNKTKMEKISEMANQIRETQHGF